MMKTNMQITCPKCQHEFQAADALRKHLEIELEQQAKQLQAAHEAKEKALEQKLDQISQRETQIDAEVERLLKERGVSMKATIKAELELEYAESIAGYQKKFRQQQDQIKELRSKEIEIEELKGRLTGLKQDLELKYKRQFNEQLDAERARLKEVVSEEYEHKLREQAKLLTDQKAQIETMRRKIGQGSMQLQGEVQELILEERLGELFPGDEISEVGKGVRGADVLHSVMHDGRFCGSIIYESKNTQSFNHGWIDKLRADQLAAGAQTAVLVTRAMPKDFEGDYFVEKNVVVCTVRLFPVVASLCRTKLIELRHQASRFHMQKDKMGLLYQYLTSDEFRLHLEELVDGFSGLKSQLDAEKRALTKQWNTREKQIDKLLLNTAQIYGSIKGIAGSGVKEIKSLELSD